MAKIKKLKENGATLYPVTIPEAVVDINGFTLADFMDRLLDVLAKGGRDNLDLAFSDLQTALGSEKSLDMYLGEVNDFIDKVNTFLNDADASDTTINRWKEIESFLAGITDTKTLTGLLEENLASAKSYTDSKVTSSVGNAVTMASNAEGTDRVLVSAGANKTAKDSGVALSSLAKTDMSNVSLGILESKIKSAGFVPTIVLPISFTGDEGTISGDFNEIREAFNSAAQGEAHILFVNSADNSYILIVNLIRNNEDSYFGYVLQKSYIQSVVVDMSGVNANVTFHDYLDFTETYLTGVPVATASRLGGVKSGNHITVGGDGSVTVTNSQKATNDSAGNNISTTYLKASAVTDVTDYKEITV